MALDDIPRLGCGHSIDRIETLEDTGEVVVPRHVEAPIGGWFTEGDDVTIVVLVLDPGAADLVASWAAHDDTILGLWAQVDWAAATYPDAATCP